MTCIITGDIINSRSVETKQWMDNLKDIFNTIGNKPKTWEIYRGDSFQIEIKNVEEAFLFACKLKSSIKKIKGLDIRLAIGIGDKSFNTDRITEGNGQAFINSGYAFDNLLKKSNLALKSEWENIDDIMNTSIGLALLTMDYWTINSAAFVEMYLKYPNQAQKIIARKLNISESSASERRKRSGIDEIMKLEKLYRKIINQKIAN